MTESPSLKCPVCGSDDFRPFFRSPNIPALSCALWPTVEEARDCARGTLTLARCSACGFVENTTFDEKLLEYDATYENALHFSSVYRDYARREAEELVKRYDLHGKKIVDIGCGDGQFLSLLCELGGNTGFGYDPSYVADDKMPPLHPDVTIETRYFTAEDAAQHADLVLSRQVLEHIPDPAAFMRMLRSGFGDRTDTIVSFEVPNAEYVFKDLSVWDLIYEHCNQFTEPSLRTLFELSGFDVIDVHFGFGNQTLTIDASPRPGDIRPRSTELQEAIDASRDRIDLFDTEAASRIGHWTGQMREWNEAGRRVALWGAGARGTLFLNIVQANDAVGKVVDINPRKHGTCMPGTGHDIQPPSALVDFSPDIVLLMNPNYREEVGKSLAEIGVEAELVTP